MGETKAPLLSVETTEPPWFVIRMPDGVGGGAATLLPILIGNTKMMIKNTNFVLIFSILATAFLMLYVGAPSSADWWTDMPVRFTSKILKCPTGRWRIDGKALTRFPRISSIVEVSLYSY